MAEKCKKYPSQFPKAQGDITQIPKHVEFTITKDKKASYPY